MIGVSGFGITIVEIFTDADTPYPDMGTDQVLDLMSAGHIMAMPEDMAVDVFNLCVRCWHLAPAQRPGFQELMGLLELLRQAPEPLGGGLVPSAALRPPPPGNHVTHRSSSRDPILTDTVVTATFAETPYNISSEKDVAEQPYSAQFAESPYATSGSEGVSSAYTSGSQAGFSESPYAVGGQNPSSAGFSAAPYNAGGHGVAATARVSLDDDSAVFPGLHMEHMPHTLDTVGFAEGHDMVVPGDDCVGVAPVGFASKLTNNPAFLRNEPLSPRSTPSMGSNRTSQGSSLGRAPPPAYIKPPREESGESAGADSLIGDTLSNVPRVAPRRSTDRDVILPIVRREPRALVAMLLRYALLLSCSAPSSSVSALHTRRAYR